jgi:hypothetical protein
MPVVPVTGEIGPGKKQDYLHNSQSKKVKEAWLKQ